jgi:GNAT superfamily N-acetyltransferase
VIRIRPMTAVDLPLGLRLSQQAGWNQTAADWQRFLDLEPSGCFIAEWDATPAATLTTCIFGSVAWIAMVLVEESLRRRGLGQALLRHALEFLEQKGVRSVRLDATALGRPLYEKLGFVEEHQLARYEGALPSQNATPVPGVDMAGPEDVATLAKLDQAITGTDRGKLLQSLFSEFPEAVRVVRHGGNIIGFRTSRPGRVATMLGPCLATAAAGPLLFRDAWQRHAGQRVLLDIATRNTAAVTLAEEQGLTVQRHLLRMCRGPRVTERPGDLWASSGPEMG